MLIFFGVGCIYGRSNDGQRFGFFCHAALEFLLQSGFHPVRRHSEEYCAMYDICGKRSDGKVLNCPVGSPSVKPLFYSLKLFES
ncbi:hypothetical protein CASFOL_029459 [Castilleja foliolosa]|uniref:starch synthase n=1 Tax=Castilleja foliolosa TaxID=1961234 RepID=A0ABD3CBK2_9LAMI